MASSITLSDDQYNYLVNELPKGYVLIKENDKEYKAEFSLEKRKLNPIFLRAFQSFSNPLSTNR